MGLAPQGTPGPKERSCLKTQGARLLRDDTQAWPLVSACVHMHSNQIKCKGSPEEEVVLSALAGALG